MWGVGWYGVELWVELWEKGERGTMCGWDMRSGVRRRVGCGSGWRLKGKAGKIGRREGKDGGNGGWRWLERCAISRPGGRFSFSVFLALLGLGRLGHILTLDARNCVVRMFSAVRAMLFAKVPFRYIYWWD